MPAQTLADVPNYKIERLLAEGGMGVVYLATDIDLRIPVALKIMKPEHAENPELRQRFLGDARALARVSHANVIHVYRIGELGNRPFFALEYAEGGSLGDRTAELQRAGKRMRIGEALEIVEAMARGLEAIHKQNLIHRDVKPDNVLFKHGAVRLTDLGIAKQTDAGTIVTKYRAVIGTQHYMSPEQALAQTVTPQSDLYSLGIVLFELLTGRVPRDLYDRELPPEARMCQTLVDKLANPNPGERFASAAEVAREIQRIYEVLPPEEEPRAPKGGSTSQAQRPPSAEELLELMRAGDSAIEEIVLEGGALPSPVPRPALTQRIRTSITEIRRRGLAWLVTGAVAVILIVGVAVGWSYWAGGDTPPAIALRTPATFIEERARAIDGLAEALASAAEADPANKRIATEFAELDRRYAQLADEMWTAQGAARATEFARAALSSLPIEHGAHTRAVIERVEAIRSGTDRDENAIEVDGLLAQAKEHLLASRFVDAVDTLQAILKLDPQHPEATEQLDGLAEIFVRSATANLHAKEYQLSARNIEQGLVVRPNYSRLLALKPYFDESDNGAQ